MITRILSIYLLLLISNFSFANQQKQAEEGKVIAENVKKGNCVACHIVGKATLPGNIAPPLVLMKVRFPNKKDLYNKIWDASATNKHTMMPPFGKHKILTDEEINKIVVYLYTLK